MASYLYYERNSPVVSDAAFDQLSKLVADTWDFLAPIRQWQLESPEAILSGGSHIKITRVGEGGAISMHLKKFNVQPHGCPIPPGRWRFSEEFRCDYATLRS